MTAKLITARYGGTCATCKNPVVVGDRVYWSPGSVSHERCTRVPVAPNRAQIRDEAEQLESDWLNGIDGPPVEDIRVSASRAFDRKSKRTRDQELVLKYAPEIYYSDGENPRGMTPAQASAYVRANKKWIDEEKRW